MSACKCQDSDLSRQPCNMVEAALAQQAERSGILVKQWQSVYHMDMPQPTLSDSHAGAYVSHAAVHSANSLDLDALPSDFP